MILCQINVDDDDDDDQSEYDSDHEKDEDASHDEDDVTNDNTHNAKGERHTCVIFNACSISCRSFFSSCIIRCEPSSF